MPTSDRHRVFEHRFRVEAGIDEVFALFNAISERDWVPGWDPEPIFPDTLSVDAGAVFSLDREGRREVWTVLHHDPEEHRAEYLAITPEVQHRWIEVHCTPEPDGTEVWVRYRVTALGAPGQAALDELDATFLAAWEEPVRRALGLA